MLENLTKIKRAEAELEDLKRLRDNFVRNNPGKPLPVAMKKGIKKLEDELEKTYNQKYNLGDLLPADAEIRRTIYSKVIAISLAADFLIETVEEVKSALDKYNIDSPEIRYEASKLTGLAQKTACRLLGFQKGLLDHVLLDNQPLLKKLMEDTMIYIEHSITNGAYKYVKEETTT